MNGRKKKHIRFILEYTVSFAVLFLLIYLGFILNHRSFIWFYDGNKQHFPALLYLRDYYLKVAGNLFSGHFTLPMFDFSIGMGEDILTTLNFYGMGNPLTLFSVFVPKQHMEMFYDFLVAFRMYLAGLTFIFYCRNRGKGRAVSLAGAWLYVFSGYVLHVAVKHPFFISPMILLPLMLTGVDRYREKKRSGLLIGSVFLCALNGFYFFYMNSIFVCLSALISVFAGKMQGKIKVFCGFALRYVAGTAMAASLFLPVILSFLSSSRNDSAVNPGNLWLFDGERYLTIFSGLIGTPHITWDYLGMAAIVLPALIVLFATRGRWKLKSSFLIWTLMMLIPAGGYIMNGFSYVSGRFLYLVTFVYAYCVVEVLPEFMTMKRLSKVLMLVMTIGYTTAAAFGEEKDLWYTWFGVVTLILTILVLFLLASRWAVRWRWQVKMSLVLGMLAISLIGNGWLLFDSHAQNYMDQFLAQGQASANLAEAAETEVKKCADDEFYRVDVQDKEIQNTGLASGIYGVSTYLSLSNPYRLSWDSVVENGAVEDSMFKVNGLDQRSGLEALACVRYYIAPAGDDSKVPCGFERRKTFTKNGAAYNLYENPTSLAFGTTYDAVQKKTEEWEKASGCEKESRMLTTMVRDDVENETSVETGKTKDSGTPELPYEITGKRRIEIQGEDIIVKKKHARLKLKVEADSLAETYVRLGDYEITNERFRYCDITASLGTVQKSLRVLTPEWNWYFGRKEYLFHLGKMSGEMEITLEFQVEGRFSKKDLQVFGKKEETIKTQINRRNEYTLQNIKRTGNIVRGEINVPEKRYLQLSVPYSSGWRAYVDGKETETYAANVMFLGMDIPAGNHTVEIRYRTPGLVAGVILSLIGCLAAGFILWYERKERKHGL